MKSSHFAGSEIRRWFSAIPFGLLEKANVKRPHDGEDSLDTRIARVDFRPKSYSRGRWRVCPLESEAGVLEVL